MKRYISAANRRKQVIDITYFYREDRGNEHRRASFNLGIGATYITNFSVRSLILYVKTGRLNLGEIR